MEMTDAQLGLMREVNAAVYSERENQNFKWGLQRHSMTLWLAILGEEFGEICQAVQVLGGLGSVKDTDADDLYTELLHVAAVASAIAEHVLEIRRVGDPQ